MPTAPVADQLRLLDVQDADLRIQQARHKRDHLPVHAQLAELSAQDTVLDDEAIARGAEVTDLRREVTKAEDDVQTVRARADRDRARLESGSSSAKDLQALQGELELLERRQSNLEDVELEVMERLEAAEAEHERVKAQREDLTKRVRELEHERNVTVRSLDAEIEQTEAERAAAAEGLDAALLALYERVRGQNGGIGAALLRGSTCGGCHMTLNPSDREAIERAAPEHVVRCEECGTILVRKAAQ
ncbi:zinc ribbon domain-containing protein [Demequina muriae]|uniref:C4-type zinc ribbon domain-containing protein n=1 Tax=Demequina muriae TaxID=3051664 RepID=A0ABT8GJ91_9MICO|nr:C4-type zinc ribbon domain-containing protein [Demequina sp. EGI L300058]MDN4481503.1 C4-type zinc ribbon domain-containing protein [Demequina sp. EGI L300058]